MATEPCQAGFAGTHYYIYLGGVYSWPSVFMRFTPFDFSILESCLEFAVERD